jgi:hypothetical protein
MSTTVVLGQSPAIQVAAVPTATTVATITIAIAAAV